MRASVRVCVSLIELRLQESTQTCSNHIYILYAAYITYREEAPGLERRLKLGGLLDVAGLGQAPHVHGGENAQLGRRRRASAVRRRAILLPQHVPARRRLEATGGHLLHQLPLSLMHHDTS